MHSALLLLSALAQASAPEVMLKTPLIAVLSESPDRTAAKLVVYDTGFAVRVDEWTQLKVLRMSSAEMAILRDAAASIGMSAKIDLRKSLQPGYESTVLVIRASDTRFVVVQLLGVVLREGKVVDLPVEVGPRLTRVVSVLRSLYARPGTPFEADAYRLHFTPDTEADEDDARDCALRPAPPPGSPAIVSPATVRRIAAMNKQCGLARVAHGKVGMIDVHPVLPGDAGWVLLLEPQRFAIY